VRKVIVEEWMSLGGVVQAPGAADEDDIDPAVLATYAPAEA
jgi:hypothetical protein